MTEKEIAKKNFGKMQLMNLARRFRIRGKTYDEFRDSHEACTLCDIYGLDDMIEHYEYLVWYPHKTDI